MKLNKQIIDEMKKIHFFENCGKKDIKFSFPINCVDSYLEAIKNLESLKWQDAKTEAQGDLTAFLAKKHSNNYGGYWNNFAKEAQILIQKEINPLITVGLEKLFSETRAIKHIETDLVRVVMYYTYAQFSPPNFFGIIFDIYKSGHLPCGWVGKLNNWPKGAVIVF